MARAAVPVPVRRRRAIVAAILAFLLAVAGAGNAAAITNGTVDGDAHPYVGLFVARDASGDAIRICSGALISPKVFITAGHCTAAPTAVSVALLFTADPIVCGCTVPHVFHGAMYTHPLFDERTYYEHDLGVVVVDGDGYDPGSFARLPELRELDALRTGRGTTFDSVGYGRQWTAPDAASWRNQWVRQRMVAHPWLVQINTPFVGDFALYLSNNAASGGTCNGDSGGPNLLAGTNVIAAVTSFGVSQLCVGDGGVYRLDGADDLDWLEGTFSSLY
jgi:hypothetical protein